MRRHALCTATITGLALGLAAATALASRRARFQGRIGREMDEVVARSREAPEALVTEAQVDALPEPVARWLRAAGVVGQPVPAGVRLRQAGEFRLAAEGTWVPFSAEQVFTTHEPAYVWSARFQMAPLLTMIGRDRFVDSQTSILMRALGVLTVANSSAPALSQAALLRYLGEVIWFPAVAVAPFISWAPQDGGSAVATITYAGITASATFDIDPAGHVTRIVADRYNDAKRRLERWTALSSAFGEQAGVGMPIAGSALWNYADGDYPYIRWRLVDVAYAAAEAREAATAG